MSYEDFVKAHNPSDTDNEPSSLHHSLGKSPNQAAPGNHKHDDLYEQLGTASQGNVPVGAVFMWPYAGHPANYLELNGQTINFSQYPELFEAWGVQTATLTLPNMADRFPIGYSATKPLRSTGGTDTHDHNITTTVTAPANNPAGAATGTGDVNTISNVTVTADAEPTDHTPMFAAFKFLVRAV